MHDRQERVKFLRALTKVANAAFNAIRRDDFQGEKFAKAMQKHAAFLNNITPVFLDKPYNKKLLEFVNLCLSCQDKERLNAAANELDKLKNSTIYKRGRRRRDDF